MCIIEREAQLLACDIGIIFTEMVVTNGAPLASMVNLQPTTGIGTIAQADGTFGISNAFNTHIFVMPAIVAAPTQVTALINPSILRIAAKVIH